MDTNKVRDDFNSKGYAFLDDFVEPDDAKRIAEEIRKDILVFGGRDDHMVTRSPSIRDLEVTDKLLEFLKPHIEEYTGLSLLPTYAYSRIYEPGETLKAHLDRPACEISVTLTLDCSGEPWEIFMADQASEDEAEMVVEGYKDEQHPVKNVAGFKLSPGQGVVYKGEQMVHWRNEFEGDGLQTQVFLHYVDANGPNTNQLYDGRQDLAHRTPKKLNTCYIIKLSLDQFQSMEDYLKNLEHLHARMIETTKMVNEKTYRFDITDVSAANLTTVDCGVDHTGDQTIRNGTQLKFSTLMALEDFDMKFSTSNHDDADVKITKGCIIVMPSFVTYSVNNNQSKAVVITMDVYGPPFK